MPRSRKRKFHTMVCGVLEKLAEEDDNETKELDELVKSLEVPENT